MERARPGRSPRPDGSRAPEADDRAVASNDLDRGETRPDDDPLALGGLDLLHLGRHVGPAAAIHDGHGARPAPPGRSRGVHRGAAATDDHGRTAQVRVLAEIDPLEEQGRGHHAGRVVAGDAEPPALRRAGREEDGPIALALEVAEGEVAAHRGIQPQVHAEPDDPGDLGLEDIARQPIRRDPDGHHAAGHAHRLEHRDRIAETGEVVRRRHAGRPAAHDADLLRSLHGRRLDGRQLAVLGGEALERADRDRFVQHAATAHGLAGRGADPAADRRERIDLGGDGVRVVVPLRGDEPDVPARVGAGGARDLARRPGDRRATRLHRPPDLPTLRAIGRLPRHQVAERRRMVALEDLAGHGRHRQPRRRRRRRVPRVDRWGPAAEPASSRSARRPAS